MGQSKSKIDYKTAFSYVSDRLMVEKESTIVMGFEDKKGFDRSEFLKQIDNSNLSEDYKTLTKDMSSRKDFIKDISEFNRIIFHDKWCNSLIKVYFKNSSNNGSLCINLDNLIQLGYLKGI